MPRPPRQKLKFDFDSLQSHVQEIFNHLEELRQRATRDYNRVINMMVDQADAVTLEQARNNALNAFERYFAKKIDLLKIHKDVTLAKNKVSLDTPANGAANGNLSGTDKLDMQQMLKKLRDMEPKK